MDWFSRCEVALGRGQLTAKMRPVREPLTPPVVLSPEQTRRLLAAAPELKYQAALLAAYGPGVRAHSPWLIASGPGSPSFSTVHGG